jgi:hypothetical protein
LRSRTCNSSATSTIRMAFLADSAIRG